MTQWLLLIFYTSGNPDKSGLQINLQPYNKKPSAIVNTPANHKLGEFNKLPLNP